MLITCKHVIVSGELQLEVQHRLQAVCGLVYLDLLGSVIVFRAVQIFAVHTTVQD